MARTTKKTSKRVSTKSRLSPVPKKLGKKKVAPHGAWNRLLKDLTRISTSRGRMNFAKLALDAARGDMFVVDRYGRAMAVFVPPKGAALLILLAQPQNAKILKKLEKELENLAKS